MPRLLSRHKFLYETFLYFIRLKSEDPKKGGDPFFCFAFDETAEKSIINNNEVLIGKTESGGFNALFMYKNVGFFFSADGLSQDEFVSVISSLLK